MMKVRSANFRDLVAVQRLYKEATSGDDSDNMLAQLSEDNVVPQAILLRLWHSFSNTVSSLVPLYVGGDALYVAEDENATVGFIQAQAATRRARAWQILNLCVVPTAAGHFAKERLITYLCQEAQSRGITRLYVSVPLDHPLLSVFMEHGFVQYATEQILYNDATTGNGDAKSTTPTILRPARRDDIAQIYLLYLRATPNAVAAIEAPFEKAWISEFQQGILTHMSGRDDIRHFVVERPEIAGWSAVRPASSARPSTLWFMCDSDDSVLCQNLVEQTLQQIPIGPVACVLRHYDAHLIDALRKHQFDILGTQVLLVRDLGAKARVHVVKAKKQPVLARAAIARSSPLENTGACMKEHS